MESSQIEQMLRWLDEERKRDKNVILKLQERIEQQRHMIDAQAKEIGELEQQVAILQIDIQQTENYPPMVEKVQHDLSGMIDEIREQVRRDKLEAQRTRRSEVEMLTEQIAEVDRKIRPFFHYAEELAARASGEQRLQTRVQQISNELSDFSKRVDDRLQSIVYLEEQRRADTRRISTIEGELPDLRKKPEELTARITRLEDGMRKIPARVEEATQIAKSYDPLIEELRVADFQREQRMKQYADQAEKVNEEVVRLVEQTQRYALLYNQNRQALEALEAFQVRIEKRQNEIAEMQRVAEERLRRQWEEWQETLARDWQKRQVTEEDRWRRQDINNQKIQEQFAEIEEPIELYFQEIVALWNEIRGAVERWGSMVRETIPQNVEVPDQHVKELRKFAEEKHKELL
jgi:chromosome segregation ATPase